MFICDIVIDFASSFRHIENMDDTCKILIIGKLPCQIRRSFQFFRMEVDRFCIMEDRSLQDLCFDKILEDMASV